MGRRHEQRTKVSLPVRISGVDRDGNPFAQTATVVEISCRGARLSDVRCLRESGDFIEIKHNNLRAKFRVEWIGTPGTIDDGQAGVSSIEPSKNIWRRDPGPMIHDSYEVPAVPTSSFAATAAQPAMQHAAWDGKDRRGSSRIHLSGTVRVQVEGASFPIWAELSDISLGGCYVHMLIPITKGSTVTMSMTIQQQTFTAKGSVVTADPGVGAGIKFNLDANEMLDLWRLLRKLGSTLVKGE
jgi:hypothetical protein